MAQRTVDTDVFDAEVLAELIVAMAEVEQFKKGKLDLPVLSSLDPAALALAVFAAVLLFAMKQGLARSLGFTAIAGLVLKFAGF